MKSTSCNKSQLIQALLFSALLLLSVVSYAQPVAGFTSTSINGCSPILVQFTDQSAGNPTEWKWDLGNGTISYLQNPSATYFNPGNYTVKLIVKNAQGRDSITKVNFITVFAAAAIDFTVSQNTGCNQVAAVFTDRTQSTGNNLSSWQWDFGDGLFSNEQNPSHQYPRIGNYNVSLKVINSNGCVANLLKTAYIQVNGVKASFNNTISSRCTPNRILFQNTSTGNGSISYHWSFGNGDTAVTLNPDYTFPNGGTYTVKLTLQNEFGCIDSMVKILQVESPVRASFAANITSSCKVPVSIQFTNQVLNGNNYFWCFGDSLRSNLSNPLITFSDTGRYTVKLVVRNSNGCVDSVTKLQYLKLQKPYVTFDNLPDSACTSVTKTMTVSVKSIDPVVSYWWDFGDGGQASTAAPTHTFTTQGYSAVSLITTDAAGCKDTARLENAIRLNGRPVANFTADILNACASTEISFTDRSTTGTNQWMWDFGDNYQMLDQHAKHVFTDTGFMNVKLIASIGGCSDTLVRPNYIYIKPAIAKFKFDFTCANSRTFSMGNYSIGADRFLWNFGDGNTSTLQDPVHTFADTGNYLISLTAYNSSTGCNFFKSKPAKVVKLRPNFYASDTVICRNGEIRFTSTISSMDASRFVWSFGDGSSENTHENTITHVYEQPGNYTVRLITINLLSCKDTIIKSMYVRVNGPRAKFGYGTNSSCANALVSFTDSSLTDNINPVQTWQWNYGDGQTQILNAPPFTHLYASRGNYFVSLKVTDSKGCADSFMMTAPINVVKISSSFSVSDTVACTERQLTFVAPFSEPGIRYRWDFGDGGAASVQSPRHSYSTEGVYTVKAVIEFPSLGCADSSIRTSYINIQNPVAAFAMSDSFRTCPPLIVQFTDLSVNGIEAIWDFGDGSSTNTHNPSHFYSYPGIYTVTLTVKGRGGCSSQMQRRIEVKGPKGYFTYNPLNLCKPQQVGFTAHSIDAVSYIWDFNDGSTSMNADSVTTHHYSNAGIYLPKLMLVDDIGCKVPINGADTITLVSLIPQFTFPDKFACLDEHVLFNNITTSNDAIIRCNWNFGDGSHQINSGSPSHEYTLPGTYYPTLVVTTAKGCTDSVAAPYPVKVSARPNVAIQSTANGCAPLTVTFNGTTNDADSEGIKWNWDFNNGNSAATQNPLQQNYTAGVYSVKLTAANSAGCEKVISKTIEAWAQPALQIAGDTVICRGTIAQLSASGASVYAWNPSAGISCANCAAVNVQPASSSTFWVTATGAHGCNKKDSITVRVVQPFILHFNNSEKICPGKSVLLKAAGAQAYAWSPATGLSNATIASPEATIPNSIQYRVIGTGEMGCFRDTGFINVQVNALPTVDAGQDKKITAGAPVDLIPVVSSDVTDVRWSPTGSAFRNSDNGITVKPTVSTEYTVDVKNANGCIASDKVNVTVVSAVGDVFLPNTFSPNGDGVNDVFYPRAEASVKINRFKIFDKSGLAVFEKINVYTNDAVNGWDGIYRGVRLASDVYIYVIDVMGTDGKSKTMTGNISLMR